MLLSRSSTKPSHSLDPDEGRLAKRLHRNCAPTPIPRSTMANDSAPALLLSTFSIVARDPETGMFGVAVSTAVPSVGSICPFAAAGVGAIATQAFVNPYLGLDGLTLLAAGRTAAQALMHLVEEDPGRTVRQLSIVDRAGRVAAHTGSDCVPWCGHRLTANAVVAGNMLVGEETLTAMMTAFERTSASDLMERLMSALEAGQAAGGDFRGRQSAALKVVHEEEFPYCDLRVDEHSEPVAELRRILEIARVELFPFLHGLPGRGNPLGTVDPAKIEILRRPPAERGLPAAHNSADASPQATEAVPAVDSGE